MEFNNVEILGYTHSSNFFGDDVFRFRADKNLSLQGTIVDLTGDNKISTGIWSGMNLLSNFSDYEPVIINGKSLGSGRMESLNFIESQDIDTRGYTANIVIYDTGNLFNMTGDYYTGIDRLDYRYVDDLAEDFSYTTDGSEKNYTQRIAVSCFSGDAGNPLDLAKEIANHLFTVNGISGLIGNYSGVNTNPKYTENIDLINNTYQVDKTVKLNNTSGLYSIDKSHSVTLDQNGITSVQEKGSVKGMAFQFPFSIDLWESAINGVTHEIENSYDRCSQIFNAYKASSSAALNSKIVFSNRTLNKFNDTIDYVVTFDNRKANIATSYSHNQTSEISRRADGIYEVSIKGSIIGWGLNYTQKFEAAKAGFTIIGGTLKSTAALMFLNYARSISPYLSGGGYLLGKKVTYSQFEGSVNYIYTYVSDYAYKGLGENILTFKKELVTVTDNYKNKYINKYGIFNQKEIIQEGSIYTPAIRSVSLNLVGRRGWPLNAYLSRAIERINAYIPGEHPQEQYLGLNPIDVFIKNSSYTFNPNENIFDLTITWEYTSNNPEELSTIIDTDQTE